MSENSFINFFVTMGLWGCFQSSGDVTVHTSKMIGEGIEFGFAYGTTGDYRFDLSSNGSPGYHTFTNFTMDYGPFYGLFVFPGASLATSIMWFGRNWWGGLNSLLAIFIILLIIRTLTLFITLRSSMQNEKMTEVQGKIAEINAKYKNATDTISKQKKTQETMEVYKKYKIKPFAAFEQVLITLPVFMIVYRVITIVRPIKLSVLFGLWNFAVTPTSEIFSNFSNGGWIYIFLLMIILPFQYLSMKLPQVWAKRRNRNATALGEKANKQFKKTRLMQVVFMGVMCLVVAFSATGVGIYWMLSSIFSIIQSYIIHIVIIKNRVKNKSIIKKLEKLGIY